MPRVSLRKGDFDDSLFEAGKDLRILSLFDKSAQDGLVEILEDAPLYRVNMEELLDTALSKRASDVTLSAALKAAYAPNKLPNTPNNINTTQTHGQLLHPVLDHMSGRAIASFYCQFLEEICENEKLISKYGFDNVLHKHKDRFFKKYDGYAYKNDAFVRLPELLYYARRAQSQHEDKIQDPLEGYLECAFCQYKKALDIDKTMSLGLGEKIPHWIRGDVRSILRCEEEKQKFAKEFIRENPTSSKNANALIDAIKQDASGLSSSSCLSRLVSETLNVSSTKSYFGSGSVFAKSLSTVINS